VSGNLINTRKNKKERNPQRLFLMVVGRRKQISALIVSGIRVALKSSKKCFYKTNRSRNRFKCSIIHCTLIYRHVLGITCPNKMLCKIKKTLYDDVRRAWKFIELVKKRILSQNKGFIQKSFTTLTFLSPTSRLIFQNVSKGI